MFFNFDNTLSNIHKYVLGVVILILKIKYYYLIFKNRAISKRIILSTIKIKTANFMDEIY